MSADADFTFDDLPNREPIRSTQPKIGFSAYASELSPLEAARQQNKLVESRPTFSSVYHLINEEDDRAERPRANRTKRPKKPRRKDSPTRLTRGRGEPSSHKRKPSD